jgi:hypothetical protein
VFNFIWKRCKVLRSIKHLEGFNFLRCNFFYYLIFLLLFYFDYGNCFFFSLLLLLMKKNLLFLLIKSVPYWVIEHLATLIAINVKYTIRY